MIATGLRVLCHDERAEVHEAALEVLERRGVFVAEHQLQNQLQKRGGRPGLKADEIRIPRELVEESLRTANRRPVLHCVSGKALQIHSGNRCYGSLVTDPFIADYTEGVRRPRLDDIARHARLGDALPLVDNIHLMDDTIPGLDPSVSVLKALELFVSNTTTSYHCAPGSVAHTRYWIGIAEIMAGGSLKENPILAAYVPVISPLVLAEHNVEQLRMFIARGVVCNVGPCAIAGATAPYPVAGLLVQSWAEYLAMLTATQVIEPGTAAIGGGGGAHVMDMATGESLYSGVVKHMVSAAQNELSEWLDLPTLTGNYTALCSRFDVQDGLESMMGVFATFFSRGNIFTGMGSIANACGMGPVQIVIHHDLTEMLERFRRGIDVTEEKLAVESIVSAGPRGQFLDDALTLKYLRTAEHFYASCYERCAGGQDVKSMAERAHEKAEALIASHKPAVPEERVEEVHRYVERELARLKGGVSGTE